MRRRMAGRARGGWRWRVGRRRRMTGSGVGSWCVWWPGAREAVAGQVGELSVPVQSDASGRKWVAAFEMPSRETLGPEHSLRVYAKNGDASPEAAPEPEMLEIPVE